MTSPPFLHGAALQKWNELAPMLHGLGLLTEADRDALAEYCTLWSAWQTAALNDDAPMMVKIGSQLNRLRAAFGLTPSDRARMNVKPDAAGRDDKYLRAV